MKLIKKEKVLLLTQDVLLVNELSEKLGNVGFDVLVASDTTATLKLIELAAPSVVLLDLSMESNIKQDLLTLFNSKGNLVNTALIVLSSGTDSDTMADTFFQGASDFIAKPIQFKELLARIKNQIKIHNRLKDLEDKIKELTKRNSVLEQLAITDSLTELYNKGYILQRLESEMIRSARYNEPISLIILDLDYFKKINDSFGHVAGDNILRKLAKILVESVRDVDIVARYGGEEFIVVCPNTSIGGAAILSERIRENVQNTTFRSGSFDIKLTISLGVSSVSSSSLAGGTINSSKLIEEADLALYKAKASGRNRVAVHTNELGAICIDDSSKYKQLFTKTANTKDKFTH